jgi:hypothetical protein
VAATATTDCCQLTAQGVDGLCRSIDAELTRLLEEQPQASPGR